MIRYKKRSTEAELMDDLHLNRDQIKAILEDINTANNMLGGNRITLKALKRLMDKDPLKEYEILDVGCGDGSLLREVALFCNKAGVKANLKGIDLNGESIALARKKNADLKNTTFVQEDVFNLSPEKDGCDFLLCTLTLHHFREEEITQLIRKFSVLARTGAVINDLDRNRIAHVLFRMFSYVFMRTDIARQDGLTSIKKGFTKKELLALSRDLPGMTHHIQWRWAFRYEWCFSHINPPLL
ncbi:Ubiquinone/menaquinone biosynthesis C-methylase UbiE [Muriicola jejuensis]|uniref:Methyltransferase domain-containing protein n=1 Tax=Muriicola jejuensis TaxID=504488 RepID=A0A6P0UDR0_9FLAO|nr:methyltransferase domain-containing protein [Muriicola jejuensis]NER11335.1 methyltransferase domain-containing protein [Muriicola jejuensis]SMP21372.1 Ubiquinone/menaquinone biosynthesis C-methylase UbiE [Muriicola jejuensis]